VPDVQTITARLTDGPLKGERVEVELLQGRPPMTLDLSAADASTCRYCLDALFQNGLSADYTFLYQI
jgi:hypothetical protein